eukprot:tig00021108_g18306.t1
MEGRWNCARCMGLDKCDALLVVCERHLYVIDNYLVSESGEVVEVAPEEEGSWDDGGAASGGGGDARGAWPVDCSTEASLGAAGPPLAPAPEEGAALAGGGAGGVEHRVWKRRWEELTPAPRTLSQVREALKRRYGLRNVALEVFGTDGRAELLVLHPAERDPALARIQVRTPPPRSLT